MTDLERAYLAGLVDGEGSLSVVNRTNQPERWVGWLRLSVEMSDSEPIRLLSEAFGAKISTRLSVKGRPMFACHFYCNKAANVLRELLPYLRAKRAQAEDGILLQSKTRDIGYGWRRKMKLTESAIAERQIIILRMKSRCKKGFHGNRPWNRLVGIDGLKVSNAQEG